MTQREKEKATKLLKKSGLYEGYIEKPEKYDEGIFVVALPNSGKIVLCSATTAMFIAHKKLDEDFIASYARGKYSTKTLLKYLAVFVWAKLTRVGSMLSYILTKILFEEVQDYIPY